MSGGILRRGGFGFWVLGASIGSGQRVQVVHGHLHHDRDVGNARSSIPWKSNKKFKIALIL